MKGDVDGCHPRMSNKSHCFNFVRSWNAVLFPSYFETNSEFYCHHRRRLALRRDLAEFSLRISFRIETKHLDPAKQNNLFNKYMFLSSVEVQKGHRIHCNPITESGPRAMPNESN